MLLVGEISKPLRVLFPFVQWGCAVGSDIVFVLVA